MSHELSFTQRFNKLMGVAVLRSGYLGKPDYYRGFNYNEDAYELFGLEAPPFSYAINASPASLEGARCPKCMGACEVVGVEDTSHMSFSGTFVEGDIRITVAQGTLVCSNNPTHTSKLSRGAATVCVHSTVGEMVCLLDDIATELGY